MRLREYPARHDFALLVERGGGAGRGGGHDHQDPRLARGQVSAAVKEAHSYSTPAILVIPIESVEPGYLDWLMGETAPAVRR